MENFLTIATIVKPQGIRGEVKVLSMTDSPDDLQAFNRVYIGGKEYKILKVRPQGGNCAYLTLGGIADRNAAELLRGQSILAARDDAPDLPDGTYYIADIIGCKLLDGEGNLLGEVVEITPARTDVYEVERCDGSRLVFPAVEGLITDIDVSSRKVTVNSARLAEVAVED